MIKYFVRISAVLGLLGPSGGFFSDFPPATWTHNRKGIRLTMQDEGIDEPEWHKQAQAKAKPANAFDAIMQSKGDCVKRSDRYPVILQVS